MGEFTTTWYDNRRDDWQIQSGLKASGRHGASKHGQDFPLYGATSVRVRYLLLTVDE